MKLGVCKYGQVLSDVSLDPSKGPGPSGMTFAITSLPPALAHPKHSPELQSSPDRTDLCVNARREVLFYRRGN